MKSLKRIVFLLFFVLGNQAMMAGGIDPVINLESTGGKSFVLYLEASGDGRTEVRLVDKAGSILYKEALGRTDYLAKHIKLEELVPGTYFLEVEDALTLRSYAVELTNEQALLKEGVRRTIYKPVFSRHGRIIDLNLLSNGNEVGSILVFNQNSRLVHQEVLDHSIMVQKRFDFRKAERGDYRMVVEMAGRTFSFPFRI